ncbi:hypothetical protein NEOLI_004472 [Neolecta irregularis DAH-3]|uniref:Uncharacterized protein n=1 Tax=Neolecta irregularis (strain DAH-3) TaxID=1198029 RepID=A0A1U7LL53_NEOID|nr:hypothetical protein NEOLI_004472 [Neolecta irregularis DAH-3]|eukprot:OLL23251.1 hypothetical protein NEOLI_004472 [Neolecta irregularis DAH-3]
MHENEFLFEPATETKGSYFFESKWSENKWNSFKVANLTVDSKSMKVQSFHDKFSPLVNSTWMTLNENWDFRLKLEKAHMLRPDARPFKQFIESLAAMQGGIVKYVELPGRFSVDHVFYQKETTYRVSSSRGIQSVGLCVKIIAVLELEVEKQPENRCIARPQASNATKHGRQWYKVEVSCDEYFRENLTNLPGEEAKWQISETMLKDMVKVAEILSKKLSNIGHDTQLPDVKGYMKNKESCSRRRGIGGGAI